MPAQPITDWGTAVMTALAGALAMFMAAIPRIIGFLVILIVGWYLASAIAAAVGGFLRLVRFEDLAQRSGLSGFVRNMGVQRDATWVVAQATKWFLRLIVLLVAFDVLGLPAVSQVLGDLLLWLPNLVVALVVLVIAGLIATAAYSLVRGATAQAGFADPELWGNLARVAVWGFGIIVAVNQIGIAATLVNTLFIAIVGALALAIGLAFGLGGRETAARIVQDWYETGRKAAPKARRAAEEAGEEAEKGGRRAA